MKCHRKSILIKSLCKKSPILPFSLKHKLKILLTDVLHWDFEYHCLLKGIDDNGIVVVRQP